MSKYFKKHFHWLIVGSMLAIGVTALTVAPPTFIQRTLAATETCSADTDCPCGYSCIDGQCIQDSI